jgi:hypothetical protein
MAACELDGAGKDRSRATSSIPARTSPDVGVRSSHWAGRLSDLRLLAEVAGHRATRLELSLENWLEIENAEDLLWALPVDEVKKIWFIVERKLWRRANSGRAHPATRPTWASQPISHFHGRASWVLTTAS